MARHHKEMYKFLQKMTAGNDYLALATGHGLMIYAILVHFKRVPDSPILHLVGLGEETILQGQSGGEEVELDGYERYAAAS